MNENGTIPAPEAEERYAEAEKVCRGSFVKEKIAAARDTFLALGDYKESRSHAERCAAFLAWEKGALVRFGKMNGEEIVWRVLEEDGRSRLLMAEKPVAYLPYNTQRDHSNWSQCSLRRWLNKDFMEQCFTTQERMDVQLSVVRNDLDPRWKVENGPATRDKAFVFSREEMDEFYPTPEDRACGEWYWLRGHGWSMLSPMAVYTDGTYYEYGVNKNSDEIGVRPAMRVRLRVL